MGFKFFFLCREQFCGGGGGGDPIALMRIYGGRALCRKLTNCARREMLSPVP